MARRRLALLSITAAALLSIIYADLAITVEPLRPSSSILCVKDTVNVSWTVEDWIGGTAPVWLQVLDSVQNREVTRFDLFKSDFSGVAEAVPRPLENIHSVIYCLYDGPFKMPDVRTVEWSSTGDGQSMLIFTFSGPTNHPALESGVALNNAILINHGTVQLQAGRGVWSGDGETLTILGIDPYSWTDIMSSISNGSFHVAMLSRNHASKLLGTADERQSSLDSPSVKLEGSLTMRMSSPGQYTIHLHVGERMVDSSDSTFINVDLCPDEVEVVKEIHDAVSASSAASSSSIRSDAVAPSLPFFSVEGVLAMSGEKWLKVPGDSFPVSRGAVDGGNPSTSWSLSLWIYLLEDSEPGYRALFYKGDGGDHMGKTLSAWLCPHSNRIVLRVTSTTRHHDIGADSVATLRVRSWNHLVFAFENSTQDEEISANVFINGAADISVTFRDMDVVGNDGPLLIGRDPGNNPGPRSFMSLMQLHAWEGYLSPEQIHADYEASRSFFYDSSKNSQSLKSRFSAVHAVSTYTRQLIPSSGGRSSRGDMSDKPSGQTWTALATKQVKDAAFRAASEASALCKTFDERLKAYKIAAEIGHTESRVRFASLMLTGREHYDGDGASCGREKESDARVIAEAKWSSSNGAKAAVEQLELAVDEGSPRAAFLLAVLILSGLDGGVIEDRLYEEGCTTCRPHGMAPTGQLEGIGVGTAVLDHWRSAVRSTEYIHGDGRGVSAWDGQATARAIGLLHFAAAGGHPEAHVVLGLRYLRGNGVQVDMEAAAWYLGCAADVAYTEYHIVGAQPIVEKQRLMESNEVTVATGQKGEDDNAIQYQIHRAAQGHVPSQVAMGDLYYWGGRGMPRDQVRALEYFNLAAAVGDNTARCEAAGMYLRGEGDEANHSRALELYEIAAEDNHVRALNGLGFEYFSGNAIPRNVTRAYEYFQRAANMKQDGDSLFNAGHCLATGTGTKQDYRRAADLFNLGAQLGHVDCAYEMGIMSAQGRGVERNPEDAARKLLVVAQVGPWAKRLRAGFDCYLQGDMLCALALYSEAAELGFDVAASNAAFLLDRGRIRIATAATEGYVPSFVAIGDAFFYGRSGLPRDLAAACWWYSRASASGLVRGSYNLGYMHEHGLGLPRDFALASTYYERARKNALANHDFDQQHLNGMPIEVLISLAKLRLFFNRLSGGRLASLWERGGVREGQETRDWLQNWLLLAAIANTTQATIDWVAFMCSPPAVLIRLDGVQSYSPASTKGSAVESVVLEGIMLVVLVASLIIVLILRRRKRRSIS